MYWQFLTQFPPRLSFRSEIRLMEIVEGLCDSSSFECNHMVEEHEEQFETWWYKRWELDG